jgi:hypothetical protein
MKHFSICNWADKQHYKDRNPPWIKLYNDLLENYEFSLLSDKEKFHLVGIWILASRLKNKLPLDGKWIARKIDADSKVDLNRLIELEFIEVLADSKQDASKLQHKEDNSVPRERAETEQSRAEVDKDFPPVDAVDKETGFDEFWDVYPKKKAKEDAHKAWVKNDCHKIAEMLINDVINRSANDGQWEEVRFVPNGATYLNGKRWNDDLTKRKQSAAQDLSTQVYKEGSF